MENRPFIVTPANGGGKWIRKEKRYAIYKRDQFKCLYCGMGVEDQIILTLDHVVPPELGGSNHHGNLVTACKSCNSAKQAKPLTEFLRCLYVKGVDTNGIARLIKNQTRKVIKVNGKRR